MLGNTTENTKNVIAQMLTAKASAFDMLVKHTGTIEKLTHESRQLSMLIKEVCDALECEPHTLIETAKRLKPTDKPAK